MLYHVTSFVVRRKRVFDTDTRKRIKSKNNVIINLSKFVLILNQISIQYSQAQTYFAQILVLVFAKMQEQDQDVKIKIVFEQH